MKGKKYYVYGYIYESNGILDKRIRFEGSIENIANFIFYNRDKYVVITDEMDRFLVSSTTGGFLDKVSSYALREKILEKLLPLQQGRQKAFDVTKKSIE